VLADDLLAMVATLGHDLRGLRDCAMLLLGFSGGLRRSEIVGLDVTRDENSNGAGWIEFFPPCCESAAVRIAQVTMPSN